jgi:hypothetical protein
MDKQELTIYVLYDRFGEYSTEFYNLTELCNYLGVDTYDIARSARKSTLCEGYYIKVQDYYDPLELNIEVNTP